VRLPRDITGPQLVKALAALGYEVTRQKGSHIRITTQRDGENHEVVPYHHPIKTGTLSGILKRIAAHHGMTIGSLLRQNQSYCVLFLALARSPLPVGRSDLRLAAPGYTNSGFAIEMLDL
jgi:predicted RNA binding protein YcfA (HicA-like mRNA interferase family)